MMYVFSYDKDFFSYAKCVFPPAAEEPPAHRNHAKAAERHLPGLCRRLPNASGAGAGGKHPQGEPGHHPDEAAASAAQGASFLVLFSIFNG